MEELTKESLEQMRKKAEVFQKSQRIAVLISDMDEEDIEDIINTTRAIIEDKDQLIQAKVSLRSIK